METNKTKLEVLNNLRTGGIWINDGEFIIGGLTKQELENYTGDRGLVVLDINPSTEYPKPNKAEQVINQQFICLAVNNFMPLLEALENLVEDARDIIREYVMQDKKPECYDSISKHLEKAKAAIKLAEGGE